MCCKMCVTVALCLAFLLALSEGFFMPLSLRKQAPQTTFNSPHWMPSATSGNTNGANAIQSGFGNLKDLGPYQQQQQPQSVQQQPQQQQQQQTQHQSQAAYSSQLYPAQVTAPKYEPIPFQSVNQPQYAYDGLYPTTLNSYSQSVQLVPCLCPVNKEVIEQQQQQLQLQLQQQTSLPVAPTSSSFPAENNNNNAAAPPPQTKKTL